MSSTTQRLTAALPLFLRRRPLLIDAEIEMRKACEIARILGYLEPTSRLRVLKHAWAIEQENKQRYAEFHGLEIPDATRIDDSQVA